ncbi:universal stress protein [Mycolicibacterium sp.]|uniref:universal stress protein n=1 Tax=Mycolicibacterium sp. TaxID=2320850 RepID=UPI001DFB5D89|nr:universal stress protein [Mycolicibacterium sp.]MCB1266377.1 universal stress protein [Mycobacterium sp.]MCB1292675.1 universal stress protein [Mycobacterium sp.]MCB9409923.1 universal stress protein [Mycolicibacterium sp.]
MTVVVGYLAGKSGTAPLHLAAATARTLGSSLTVMTIVPRPWTSPSPSRVDAEYTSWAEQLAADSAQEAQRFFAALPDPVPVTYLSHAHRSVSGGLIEAVADIDAEVLVLGSSANGGLGQVVVGSTADRMLHSSPVPVAIAPRGYREPSGGRLTRVTCGFPGTKESVEVVRRIGALAARLGVRLRVITFAVRGRTMYPPEVGLHAEDSILAAWEEQALEMLTKLRTDGVVDRDVQLQVVSGNGWDQALDDAEWEDGEILALGTSPRGDVARVFLGSRGTKILRVSPVPVLVLPG